MAQEKPEGLSFRLVHILWQAIAGQPLTPQNFVPTWAPLQTLPPESAATVAAKAVALLHIGPDLQKMTCTGVLIGDGLLATNYHCMKNSLAFLRSEAQVNQSCEDIWVEFDYLAPGAQGVQTRCLAARVDKQLDIALLSIDAESIPSAGQLRAPLPVRPAAEGIPGEVILLHHPQGLPLAINERCKVRSTMPAEIAHDCGTTAGSSGSPLLDEQMRWVGLHYSGPYPNTWTVDQMENHIRRYGPSYNNRARTAGAVLEFLRASNTSR